MLLRVQLGCCEEEYRIFFTVAQTVIFKNLAKFFSHFTNKPCSHKHPHWQFEQSKERLAINLQHEECVFVYFLVVFLGQL